MLATLSTVLLFAAPERMEKAAPELPTVQLSGSTEPKGELKVGVILAYTKGTTLALFSPFLSAALRSGSANLVELSRKKAAVSDFTVGLHGVFLVGTTPGEDPSLIEQWKRTAIDQCADICKRDSSAKKCSDFLDKFPASVAVKEGEQKLALAEKELAVATLKEPPIRAKLAAELDRLQRRELEARRALLALRESPAFVRRERDTQTRLLEAENAVERARLDALRGQLLEFDDPGAQASAAELHKILAELSGKRDEIVQLRAEIASNKERQLTELDVQNFSTSSLCEAGSKSYLAAENEHVRVVANLAPYFYSFGVQLGARNQKYVQGTGIVDGVDAPPFAEVKRLSFTSKAAFSFAHIWPQVKARSATGFVETMVGHSFGRTPSDVSVKWCEPVGDGRPTIVGGDATGAGQICAEGPWGRPGLAHRLALGLWGGALETNTGWWRIGAGLRYEAVFQPTRINSALSIEVPMYINVLRADPDNPPKEVAYNGLIRVAPRVTGQFDAKLGLSWTFLLSLDLLAQRTIFLNALDWM